MNEVDPLLVSTPFQDLPVAGVRDLLNWKVASAVSDNGPPMTA